MRSVEWVELLHLKMLPLLRRQSARAATSDGRLACVFTQYRRVSACFFGISVQRAAMAAAAAAGRVFICALGVELGKSGAGGSRSGGKFVVQGG